ncbi:DUF2283 domain-containing protein [Candidatus Woesearchaeota archaeon]|nr:DUF2283 domain-containing protein [Candidatus Woesearchaeota archaeon]
MKGPLRVHYDEEGDFLEIAAGEPTPSYAEEVQPGVFVRKDETTDEVKSVGILGFKRRAKEQTDIELRLPVQISLSQ